MASLYLPMEWGNTVRGRDAPLHTNRLYLLQWPALLTNFLTSRFVDWLKEWIHEWSRQIMRTFTVRDPVPKKKWESIRPERMAIYLLFSQATFCRKGGNWLQLVLFKETLTFKILLPFLVVPFPLPPPYGHKLFSSWKHSCLTETLYTKINNNKTQRNQANSDKAALCFSFIQLGTYILGFACWVLRS